jgi:ethanolamine utilization protein EutQ
VKELITTETVNKMHNEGKRSLVCDNLTIMTPSAKDLARQFGMEIVTNKPVEKNRTTSSMENYSIETIQNLVNEHIGLENLIPSDCNTNIIIEEVLKKLKVKDTSEMIIKESDSSGIRLIRGSSVICDSFDTGNPKDRVGIKEVLSSQECPNMATGFMTFEKSSFDWTLGYDELDYIVEGNLDISVNGKTYSGHKGDIFLIPMGTSITFSSPDYCKFFFATYPVNWQELSGAKK